MKNIKKYFSLFMILTMILCSMTVFYANAAQTTEEIDIIATENEDITTEQELVPTRASDCTCVHEWHGNGTTSLFSCKTCHKIGVRGEICGKCSKTRTVCQSCGAEQ